MKQRTIGSLFDGIGAFPYAASVFGIKTIWASEILPAAISITKRHFPDMIHVGDITRLSGELLPPTDVVVFGSPCQDLSTAAGARKGLAGERSGLFMEAIRIINEMRCATNGKYPRYAIWENVPGCFSSNARRDYKAVIEAFTKTEIPMPRSDRWATAGMVRSDRVNIAWVVYDACRGFGLAQRRKRVFLIADFGKGCPEEILLVPKSLRGYPPQSFCERESVAAAFENGAHSANGFDGYNFSLTGAVSSTLGINCGMSTGRNGVVTAFNGGASPASGIAYSEKVSPTLRAGPGSTMTPFVCEPITILNDQGGNSLNVEKSGHAPTLRCNTHGNLPIVCKGICNPSVTLRIRSGCEGGGKGALWQTEKSGTLATGNDQTLFCIATTQVNAEMCEDLCPTITAAAGNSGNNKPYIIRPENGYTFGNNSFSGWNEKTATLKATGGCVGGGSENIVVKPPPPQYIVRRLTPTECERLMGFPDGWTAYGHDGKEISDGKRYSMLGNSIAVPCVVYIIQGILEQYEKEGDK